MSTEEEIIKKILAAQRELIQAYYLKVFQERPDVETILQWLEGDLEYLSQSDAVEEFKDIIKQNGNSVFLNIKNTKEMNYYIFDRENNCLLTDNDGLLLVRPSNQEVWEYLRMAIGFKADFINKNFFALKAEKIIELDDIQLKKRDEQ